LDALCLAGGVALNASMNRRIMESTALRHVFIQPAAGDAGAALGAALAAAPPTRPGERNEMRHAFLGPQFSDNVIEPVIERKGLRAKYFPDIARAVAQLLAQGKIVGWFQGRMEFGPRALGNRSILADPRKAEMKDIINARVKHREPFRPFAPAVLVERAPEYFECIGEYPFMTKVANVRPAARAVIPAIVHVDGTARLQTISRDTNPIFYRLIENFCRLTNVPVILNTSFNVRGEPIVCTPENAIDCYLNTGLDALAMGSFLLVKRADDFKLCAKDG
jgi:carbamoyltransferase